MAEIYHQYKTRGKQIKTLVNRSTLKITIKIALVIFLSKQYRFQNNANIPGIIKIITRKISLKQKGKRN